MLLSQQELLLIVMPFLWIIMNSVGSLEAKSNFSDSISTLEAAADHETNQIRNDKPLGYSVLVSDVQEHYRASSVIVVYSGENMNLVKSTLIVNMARKFSLKFVFSVFMNFSVVNQNYDYHRTRIERPLFVVFVSKAEYLEKFQQVTRSFEMSYPFWLVVFTQPLLNDCQKPTQNYFNVLFDTEMLVKCPGDSKLREWYSIDRNKTAVYEVAHWDLDNRFQLQTVNSVYERRHSLEGKELRIAVVKTSPFIQAQDGSGSSLFSQILDELSVSMNFSKRIVYRENAYGIYNESNRTWTGVIKRAHAGDVDLSVADITMTRQRLDFVDFTTPIMSSRTYLYLKQPNVKALQWSAYFRVYTTNSWVTMQVTYVLSWLVITFMRVFLRDESIPPNHVSENFLFIWGIYCQQGLSEFPTASPIRIAYFTILITASIFMAIYSACLISYLTVVYPSLPFITLEEFVKDGTYRLITFADSSDYDLIANSKDDIIQQIMKLMLDKKNLPRTILPAFKKVCKEKLALYTNEASKAEMSSRIPCDLFSIGTGRIDSLGMILTQRSQYRVLMNYHLQRFRDFGIMNRLKIHSYPKVASTDSNFHPVKINSIVTILLILGIGIVFSIIILIFEILMHRSRDNKTKPREMTNDEEYAD